MSVTSLKTLSTLMTLTTADDSDQNMYPLDFKSSVKDVAVLRIVILVS